MGGGRSKPSNLLLATALLLPRSLFNDRLSVIYNLCDKKLGLWEVIYERVIYSSLQFQQFIV